MKKLNTHEQMVAKLTQAIMSDYIGGYENSMEDYEEGSEDYITAKNFLEMPKQEMINFIKSEVVSESQRMGYAKHMNFAGTEFLEKWIVKQLEDWGY